MERNAIYIIASDLTPEGELPRVISSHIKYLKDPGCCYCNYFMNNGLSSMLSQIETFGIHYDTHGIMEVMHYGLLHLSK